jgi:tRNA(Ile)-lysidine synthase
VAVAASGGQDSTALLHATAAAAAALGIEVVALHVHHGLMADADAWWRHVAIQCARWRRAGRPLRFRGARLAGAPARSESVEAWARRERYAALGRMAREEGAAVVLLAHHRRDQAETVMLQALRGGGPAGLAAMPRVRVREGLVWARPWLDQPREAIEEYVRRHRLSFVDDTSNADGRFARSRLRREVWSALTASFPGLEASLAAVAARMAEASSCLDDLAALDAHSGCFVEGALVVPAWAALTTHRRANLLRHWAASWSPIGLPNTLLRRLQTELPKARTGQRWPAPGGALVMARGGLLWHEAAIKG